MRPGRRRILRTISLLTGSFLASLLLAGCGGERVTYEERIRLVMAHDPPGSVPPSSEGTIKVDVSGNLQLGPESLMLWYAADGDSSWLRLSLQPAGESTDRIAYLPASRRGVRFAYFIEAVTPSGARVTLPRGVREGGATFLGIRAGARPWLLDLLRALCVAGAGFFFLISGIGAWSSLQRREEPGQADQARLARWVATGTGLLAVGAGLLGALIGMAVSGRPYSGFPLGEDPDHTKTVLLLVMWGLLTWSAWGTITRRPGTRDRVSPRAFATLLVTAVVITLLLVLMPGEGGHALFPPL